ncbi:MAG: DUF3754 domain-containing protein [Planctomycetota bacterium]
MHDDGARQSQTDHPESLREQLEHPDDRFLPIRPEDLVSAIASDPARFHSVSAAASGLFEWLDRAVDLETSEFQDQLSRLYASFDPHRDTVLLDDPAIAQGDERARSLLNRLRYLFDKANFERLNEVQIEQALAEANTHGLRVRVDPERVTRLELFVRGRSSATRRRRSWRRPRSGIEHEVEVYRRLVVIVQMADDPTIILKMFRDIPVADLEALLPHAEVQMSLFDKAKVFGGGAGALGGLVTKVSQIVAGATFAATQILWVAVVALGGLAMRSFFGYRRTKHFRNSQRTHHLYYQTVANNNGVLATLVAMVGREEVKEALLAYAFLAADDEGKLVSERAIDDRVEMWLLEHFGVEINFDCPDAIETLERFGLFEDRAALRVLPPTEALRAIEAHWCSRRSESYHLDRSVDGAV